MTNALWILKDGYSQQEFSSFPFAFRTMYQSVKQRVEKGKNLSDLIKGIKIVSPLKDVHGDLRTYSYHAAIDMAKDQGLLTADGSINSKEFKHHKA
jgi:hypothetical protein